MNGCGLSTMRRSLPTAMTIPGPQSTSSPALLGATKSTGSALCQCWEPEVLRRGEGEELGRRGWGGGDGEEGMGRRGWERCERRDEAAVEGNALMSTVWYVCEGKAIPHIITCVP